MTLCALVLCLMVMMGVRRRREMVAGALPLAVESWRCRDVSSFLIRTRRRRGGLSPVELLLMW